MVRTIGSTPDDPYSLIYLTLMSAIGNALLAALLDAAARGVDVKLILPSYSDSGLVFHAGRAHYEYLLAGGVQVFERQGRMLHSKTALIDGVWSTVGSTNLDWRSFMDNDEVNAVILGQEFAAQMPSCWRPGNSAPLSSSSRSGWPNCGNAGFRPPCEPSHQGFAPLFQQTHQQCQRQHQQPDIEG